MAQRIVLLGWGGKALELHSPDAEVLVNGGVCRVSLTQWAGDLADATVLQFQRKFLETTGEHPESEEAHELAWNEVTRLVARTSRAFEVKTPIPVGV